jgi:hypothetical protein
MANTTWNSADLLNLTLSGTNNLTVSAASAAGGVRTLAKELTGKFYFEYTCTTWSTTVGVGMANPSAILSSVAFTPNNAAFVQGGTGTIWVNGSNTGIALGTRVNGDVIGVAVDVPNQLIWFRVAPTGNWNASGTAIPATGTGGISIAAITAGGLFGLCCINAAGAINVTANFGDSAFFGTTPSGFTAGLTVPSSWTFGDGFDLYATPADAIAGYWDSGNAVSYFTLVAGRFAGSRALGNSSYSNFIVKGSPSNDPIHHITCAWQQPIALSGTTLGWYFQLSDGATAQCSIVFRQDGAILLTSGGPTGTVLATYAAAVTVQSQWYAFEFEVVINNTTGSFTVRRNGNTANDFTATGLNTRGGTTNNFGNHLTLGINSSGGNSGLIDDLLWRSDPVSLPWLGDVRCYTRMPVSDASIQFTRSSTPPSQPTFNFGASTITLAANTASYVFFIPNYNGQITGATISFANGTGGTGHMKCAIYSEVTGRPGAVLATSTEILNPTGGSIQTVTFASPATVVKGTRYWFGVNQDASINCNYNNVTGTLSIAASSYASWPAANPSGTLGSSVIPGSTISITPQTNADYLNEAQEDGATSYVYSLTPGQSDLYNLAPLGTPVSTIATTVRSFMQKADASARSGAVALKSGTITAASPTLVVATTWGWAWRTDTLDPNTGAPWAGTAVDNVQIGETVVS